VKLCNLLPKLVFLFFAVPFLVEAQSTYTSLDLGTVSTSSTTEKCTGGFGEYFGNSPLYLTSVTSSSPFAVPYESNPLYPNSVITVCVSFSPSQTGTFSQSIYLNYSNQLILRLDVTGNGVVTGFVSPKYKIAGIVYAVPGNQSYVQYTDTTMLGTSTSTSNSFSTNVTTSLSICGSTGSGICGSQNGVDVTGTYTNSFTQESDTSSSFAVNQTTSFVNKWNPLTDPGLDHGNDVIYVWVNPVAWFSITSTTGPAPIQWNGYTYDLADDSNNMEVIPLRLSQLLNPSTIDSYTLGRLSRAWAQPNTDGSGPGITNQDLLTIAAQDPFSDPSYTLTLGSDGKTSNDNRFTQTTNQALWYQPGHTNSYNWSYTGTTTAGQGGKTTYSSGFSMEEKYEADLFVAGLSYDWKQSTTFTWVDQWNTLTTQMTGQAASVSITGPTVPYNGPDEFNVFVDNVYGTFMVYPVPPQ